MIGKGVSVEPFKNGIETFTGYYGTIDSDHAYIHEGLGYTASGITTIDIDGIYDVVLRTPTVASGKFIHIRPSNISSLSSGIHVQFFEDTVFSSGSSVIPVNRNRNSSNTCQCVVTAGVTVSDVGNFIDGLIVGSGGSPQSRAGGSGGASNEYVLKPDTNYLTRLENVGGVSSLVSFSVFWYEEGQGV